MGNGGDALGQDHRRDMIRQHRRARSRRRGAMFGDGAGACRDGRHHAVEIRTGRESASKPPRDTGQRDVKQDRIMRIVPEQHRKGALIADIARHQGRLPCLVGIPFEQAEPQLLFLGDDMDQAGRGGAGPGVARQEDTGKQRGPALHGLGAGQPLAGHRRRPVGRQRNEVAQIVAPAIDQRPMLHRRARDHGVQDIAPVSPMMADRPQRDARPRGDIAQVGPRHALFQHGRRGGMDDSVAGRSHGFV